MSDIKFEFNMRAIGVDPTGYYHPRWDRAHKITVTAKDRDDAARIAAGALGKEPRGWGWTFAFDSIKQVQA